MSALYAATNWFSCAVVQGGTGVGDAAADGAAPAVGEAVNWDGLAPAETEIDDVWLLVAGAWVAGLDADAGDIADPPDAQAVMFSAATAAAPAASQPRQPDLPKRMIPPGLGNRPVSGAVSCGVIKAF
jgi:hypothetical protein